MVIDTDPDTGETTEVDCSALGRGAYSIPRSVEHLERPDGRGPMKLIAEITLPSAIERFLAALEPPAEHAEIEQARPPPQLELAWGKASQLRVPRTMPRGMRVRSSSTNR